MAGSGQLALIGVSIGYRTAMVSQPSPNEQSEVPLAIRRRLSRPFDPAAEFAWLRDEKPVVRTNVPLLTGGMSEAWMVTRYNDVRKVLGDSAFRLATVVKDGSAEAGAVVDVDDLRLPEAIASAFTMRNLKLLRPRIEELIEGQLDRLGQRGNAGDIVFDFAMPVSALVICELLGIPYADQEQFQQNSAAFIDTSLSAEQQAAAGLALYEYFHDQVVRRRQAPGVGLLGRLVRDHGDEFDDQQIITMATVLTVAGYETTASTLALSVLVLMGVPEQLAAVRDDPECVDRAVEELLRYLSVINYGALRVAAADVLIGNQKIEKGEVVIAHLPSANRDEELVDRPDVLDIRRRPVAHVAFGHGSRQCVGQQLARLELRCALPMLFRRFPRLRAAKSLRDIEFREWSIVNGVRTLPVEW
ncbi:cytochrome P450 [Amycolatopsis lurida]